MGVGSRVTFKFEARRFTGRVNRVTKRASVLVEDPEGIKNTDGRTYKKFYVPLAQLERAGERQSAGEGG
jgi:hypothetical protein